jgi:beta-galactosidase
MDADWKFAFGNATNPSKDFDPDPVGNTFSYFAKAGVAQGAASERFNDSSWRKLNLPHDWAVELPFSEKGSGSHGSKALGKNFPEASVGWYRKSFQLPASDKGRRIALDFDGIFRDSQVWVNGFYLGREQSGYTSFGYDISDYVNFGGKNTIAVRVDASLEEGWFYEGAGIYRHVWMTKTAPVHVARWGTYVTTEVGKSSAKVNVAATIENDADATAKFAVTETIVGPDGKSVANSAAKPFELGPGAKSEVPTSLKIGHPSLWSVETPTLYTMVTTITQGGKEIDRYQTPFGVRTLLWDANKGFFLNGKRVQLKGVCDHQDHAGVGVAIPDALDLWRLKQLQKMGVNALRTSHNAPNPELLDDCDRLGILVMDENRETGTNPEELNNLRRLILRDRNHPSVFVWSLGNEEWSIEGNDRGARITSTMQAAAKALDPTRLATVAISGGWGNGTSTTIDVMGFNYYTHGDGKETGNDRFHAKFPNKPSVGTEDASTLSTRGIYVEDKPNGHLTAYDTNAPSWGATAINSVQHYASRPYVAGQFQWTGFDYRGEPTPFGWPSISSQFGILDLCGFPKDNFYYYKAWWSDQPTLHLFPHWNWKGREGQPVDVWVHSNCDEVELFLNGASLGRKSMPRNGHLSWSVPYAPGTLLAKGYSGGKETLSDKVETTGDPDAVQLSADRAEINGDGMDLAVVTVSATDTVGRAVATADSPITFEVSGPGRIIGVGNGDPSSHESDQAVDGVWTRKLFSGLAQIIVQSTGGPGEITITAKSPGLKDATFKVIVKA